MTKEEAIAKEYPDLRLAVWALLKRLEAIQVAACIERGNDPLINNCRHALNGWTPDMARLARQEEAR